MVSWRSQALSRLVAAAADSAPEQQAAGEQPAEGAVPAAEDPSTDQEGLVMLVQRTLYAQLKRSVASPSLAVRQVQRWAPALQYEAPLLAYLPK